MKLKKLEEAKPKRIQWLKKQTVEWKDNQLKKIKIPKMKGKGGFVGIIVGLLMGFIVVTMLVTLIPAFTEMFDIAQNSQNLNCVGYKDTIISDGNYSYNATIGSKSTIGCLAIKLYLPYLILVILIAVIVKILYDRGTQQSMPYYG